VEYLSILFIYYYWAGGIADAPSWGDQHPKGNHTYTVIYSKPL